MCGVAFISGCSSVQFGVLFVGNGLTPFVAAIFAGNFHSNVAEPAVGLRTVPVLDVGRDGDHGAGGQADGRFALFLELITPSIFSYEYHSNSTTQAGFKAKSCRQYDAGIINQQGSGCSGSMSASRPTIGPMPYRSMLSMWPLYFFKTPYRKKLPAQRLIIPCTGS